MLSSFFVHLFKIKSWNDDLLSKIKFTKVISHYYTFSLNLVDLKKTASKFDFN